MTGVSQGQDSVRYSNYDGYLPKIVVWNITSSCNLRCQHCYFDATDRQINDELSNREAKDFIEDLAKLKVSTLLFSGGEPLLRKDIFELGRVACDRAINAVLSTNGTLISKRVAEEIKKAGFSYVGISIDGTKKTHDTFRQSKGAFQSALSALRSCKKIGLKVGLRFTLTKDNFKDLSAIFDLVEEERIPRLCLYHLVYAGRGVNLKDRDLSHKEKKKFLEYIWQRTLWFYKKGLEIEILTVNNHADGAWIYLKLKKTNPQAAQRAWELLKIQGGNSSGLRIGAVDNYGNIHPDQFLRIHPLGNIRQVRFSQVWQDENNAFLSALRKRKNLLKGRCSNCNFLTICNGNFRARAEAVFGDPWQEDPACYLTDKEISGDG